MDPYTYYPWAFYLKEVNPFHLLILTRICHVILGIFVVRIPPHIHVLCQAK